MARQLRIEYEGAFYHLLSRGDWREDIFWDERDRGGSWIGSKVGPRAGVK